MLNQKSQFNTLNELQQFLANKKVLVLDPFIWTPHLETSLEIEDLSREVAASTNFESFWLELNVEDRMDFRRKLFRYFSLKVPTIVCRSLINHGAKSALYSLKSQVDSIMRPKNIDFDFDMDDSVYSSFLSVRKTANKNTAEYNKFFDSLSTTVRRIYTWADAHISKIKPDVVILFNGRYATTRIIRNYCEYHKIDYIVHERGCDKNHYSVWLNTIPHNPLSVSNSFRNFVDKNDPSRLEDLGKTFFKQRRDGNNKGWYSFMSDYESPEFSRLDNCFQNNKIVTYFTSTEDEFKALKKDLPPIGPFSEQVKAIKAVKEAAEKNGYIFVLRLHPNLANRPQSVRLSFPHVTYMIEPEEQISSYRLIERSSAIFTHNSQIALEAAAMNRHAALTGRSRFEELDFLYKCRFPNELENFFSLVETKVDTKGANLFGGYLALNGIKYQRYKPKTLARGCYGNLNLNLPWIGK